MIRVSLHGRLGNWLFQYSVGRALALRHGTDLVLDLTERRRWSDPLALRVRRLLGHFALRARLDARWPLSRQEPSYREAGALFDPAVLALGDGSWLDGFFQSPLYFESCAKTLRAELAPRLDSIRHRDPAVETAIADTNSVAVHVRRTDYVLKPQRHLCTLAYYERALALCRKQLHAPRFFIFSDDVQWCSLNLVAPDITVVGTHAEPRPIYDLALMSRCRHQVIANSTFSWWGAWLARSEGQLVIAPDRWLLVPQSGLAALPDMVPPHWLRLRTQ